MCSSKKICPCYWTNDDGSNKKRHRNASIIVVPINVSFTVRYIRLYPWKNKLIKFKLKKDYELDQPLELFRFFYSSYTQTPPIQVHPRQSLQQYVTSKICDSVYRAELDSRRRWNYGISRDGGQLSSRLPFLVVPGRTPSFLLRKNLQRQVLFVSHTYGRRPAKAIYMTPQFHGAGGRRREDKGAVRSHSRAVFSSLG